jgi:hypothetical protein
MNLPLVIMLLFAFGDWRISLQATRSNKRVEIVAPAHPSGTVNPRSGFLSSLSFYEARAMARALDVDSQEDWAERRGRGAYALPLEPQAVWPGEWRGWDDWLGQPLSFVEARALVCTLRIRSEAEYGACLLDGAEMIRAAPASWNAAHALRLRPRGSEKGRPDVARLPARPDLRYADAWAGWAHFLSEEA